MPAKRALLPQALELHADERLRCARVVDDDVAPRQVVRRRLLCGGDQDVALDEQDLCRYGHRESGHARGHGGRPVRVVERRVKVQHGAVRAGDRQHLCLGYVEVGRRDGHLRASRVYSSALHYSGLLVSNTTSLRIGSTVSSSSLHLAL